MPGIVARLSSATLVAPKVPPKFHQVSRVTFRFADGSAQTCAATTVSKP